MSSTSLPAHVVKAAIEAGMTMEYEGGMVGDAGTGKGKTSAAPAKVEEKKERSRPVDATKAEKRGEEGTDCADMPRKRPRGATPSSPGRKWTVSVAIPGSIISNAQSPELAAYLAGQIARAAAVCCIDEIVVYRDASRGEHDRGGARGPEDPNLFLARILQYLEMPQYLRKSLIPRHPDLRNAGLLNPIDCPHHMREDERKPFREGVTLHRPTRGGTFVNVGLRKDARIGHSLPPGVRVTVEMDYSVEDGQKRSFFKHYPGRAVAPSAPRELLGTYWGYSVRVADSLSALWSECPMEGGYDCVVGTSENGTSSIDDADFDIPPFKHLLVVFGGVAGIEECVEADEKLQVPGREAASLFDAYVNLCPMQGSRTIRTEEAMLIGLAALGPHVRRNEWE